MLHLFSKYFMVHLFPSNNDAYIYRKLNFMKLYKNLEYNPNIRLDGTL